MCSKYKYLPKKERYIISVWKQMIIQMKKYCVFRSKKSEAN